MPIAHIDVLVTVPPAEPPRWLTARARRVVALPETNVPAATLAELRARLPRLVAVFGNGPPAAAVAVQVHDAGLPLVLFTDDPTVKAPVGADVLPATDPGPPMDVADSLLDLVGETPLLALHRTARDVACHLLAKLEYLNPGGSVKDRPAVAMVVAAEREGQLLPGGTIVEPTSGNTGVGLAMVAALRGYHCVFTMPDKIAGEKMQLLRAYGAEVVVCPTAVAPEHPDSYYSVADRLTASTPGAFQPNQYRNPENPAAHYRTTGPEIWRQTAHRITHLVASVGTGGTISGVGRYLKEQRPDIQVIGADPEGSVYSGGGGRPYLVEGIGEDFWPTTYDPSVVDRVIAVPDASSFATARRVTREEGLHIGGSCGTAIWAALEVGRDLGPEAVVVVLLPDSGRGYLSKLYDDAWMADHGFLQAAGRRWAGSWPKRARRCRRSSTSTPTRRCGRPSPCCAEYEVSAGAGGQGRAPAVPGRSSGLGDGPGVARAGAQRPGCYRQTRCRLLWTRRCPPSAPARRSTRWRRRLQEQPGRPGLGPRAPRGHPDPLGPPRLPGPPVTGQPVLRARPRGPGF